MPRTDHSETIDRLRTIAALPLTPQTDKVSYVAASDLLEIHDATGLNLHNAPGLRTFVETVAGIEVDDNEA